MSDDSPKPWWDMLHEQRIAIGHPTIKAIATRTDLSQNHVARVLRGEQRGRRLTVEKIAYAICGGDKRFVTTVLKTWDNETPDRAERRMTPVRMAASMRECTDRIVEALDRLTAAVEGRR